LFKFLSTTTRTSRHTAIEQNSNSTKTGTSKGTSRQDDIGISSLAHRAAQAGTVSDPEEDAQDNAAIGPRISEKKHRQTNQQNSAGTVPTSHWGAAQWFYNYQDASRTDMESNNAALHPTSHWEAFPRNPTPSFPSSTPFT
jgi:hypothetical protein